MTDEQKNEIIKELRDRRDELATFVWIGIFVVLLANIGGYCTLTAWIIWVLVIVFLSLSINRK